MAEQLSNGLSDSPLPEPGETSEKSPKKPQRKSRAGQGREGPRRLAPKLNEIDFLLNLWQSDCAELRQAGVELRLDDGVENGRPFISLHLLDVSYCGKCQTFYGTKTEHMCIR
jgi:hypothetical protein